MNASAARDRRRQRELAEVRTRLIGYLQEVVGAKLTADHAQSLLEQAKAWAPAFARQLDRHFAENPAALTSPSPHCPVSVVRLLRLLDLAGYGDVVTQLKCAMCGRSDRILRRHTPEGRCCDWCVARADLRLCARCNQHGLIAARRPEGPICRDCYRTDPDVLQECANCGQLRPPSVRREDNTVLCRNCVPRRIDQCARCGNVSPVHALADGGPVCRTCYVSPSRLCGLCGESRPIKKRAVGEEPDICDRCYRLVDECRVCGRIRAGSQYRDQGFHCYSCRPRASRLCADCGQTRPVMANWPVGPLCGTCHKRRKRNPMPCARCHTVRVPVGRTDDGQVLCGPCCGTDIDFACRRCGFPGDIYMDGCCARCIASDRVRNLLSHDDGAVLPQLQPLAEALIAANPRSVRHWLASSPSAKLLARLVVEQTEITHELLDGLPQDAGTRYVRGILVATQILPQRQENFAQLQLWLDDTLKTLPPHQLRVIGPFAEWGVLRDARRRADRGRYTANAASVDRADIRVAIEFMDWLDANHLVLDSISQEHVDLWLDSHPTRHKAIISFIRWAAARHLTGDLDVPSWKRALPLQFQDEDEQHDQLRRCLNDDALPLDVRIIGALIRLYALPVARIVALTSDQFHRDEDRAYLTLDRHPVLLPPKLARLVEEQLTRPHHFSMLKQPAQDGVRYLLPGQPPSRPRNVSTVRSLMKQHGLPIIHARNTAMIEAVAELPPIIVSDLFNIHPNTAHAWAQYAQDNWADYLLAAAQTKE